MGNHGSSHGIRGTSFDFSSARSDWPLQFHTTHGEHIELSANRTRSRRKDSFCKGICFSHRPVAINEKIYINFVETSGSWSGVLRFGFTSVDPATVRGEDLPKYACPDLTNRPGSWAKALGERYASGNILLCYYVTRSGDVYYSVNGEEKGLFFGGVNTTGPLWVLLDIYGNTVTIEFCQPDSMPLNNMIRSSSGSSVSLQEQQHITSFSSLNISSSDGQPQPLLPLLRHHQNVEFTLAQLHKLQGKNIQISHDRTIATRIREEYCNAYVFASRPLRCGEKIVIQVLGVERSYVGGLAFGFTACDPLTVTATDLPDDSDLLLDRPEYWVVNKDVCRHPEMGDELSFFLTNDGEVLYSRNNSKVSTLMHVDRTLPLWPFFDVFGNVQKIRVLGVTVPHNQRLLRNTRATSYAGQGLTVNLPSPPLEQTTLPGNNQAPMMRSFSVPSTVFNQTPGSPVFPTGSSASQLVSVQSKDNNPVLDNDANECTVCYEKPANAVLYTCGHLCMCYECAMAVKGEKSALCPICRQQIKDVIKIFRT